MNSVNRVYQNSGGGGGGGSGQMGQHPLTLQYETLVCVNQTHH